MQGDVIGIVTYGVFVDVVVGSDTCKGIIHISEITSERIKAIEDYVSMGAERLYLS